MENLLESIIDDKTYKKLNANGVLSQNGIRNMIMQKAYKLLMGRGYSQEKAINILLNFFPYLTYNSIRRTVYKKAVEIEESDLTSLVNYIKFLEV